MQISVIIPVYNTKLDELKKCITSILRQTFSDFEIIIVDDGSEAGIADALDELEKKETRIRILHKKNEGVSLARNYGVSKARGRYISFVDADDILTPWAFEQGIFAVNSTNSDIVIGRVLQTGMLPEVFPAERKNAALQVLKTRKDRVDFERHIYLKNVNDWGRNEQSWMFNWEGCWAHLVKKEVAEAVPFIPGIAIAEDTIWAVQLIRNEKRYKICLVDDLWYYYIQNSESVLHKYTPDLAEKISRAVNTLNPIYEAETDADLYNAYLQWILSKLKQIIIGSYVHPECRLDTREKKNQLPKMLGEEPWKTILMPRRQVPRLYRVKMFLYRKNLMLSMFDIKARIERMK